MANSFQIQIDDALASATTLYQWGNAVPIKPQQFASNLIDLAKAFGLNDWSTGRDAMQAIMDATIEYAAFYAELLTRPMPQNPTPEFEAWYNEVHPLGGPKS